MIIQNNLEQLLNEFTEQLQYYNIYTVTIILNYTEIEYFGNIAHSCLSYEYWAQSVLSFVQPDQIHCNHFVTCISKSSQLQKIFLTEIRKGGSMRAGLRRKHISKVEPSLDFFSPQKKK